MSWLERPRGAAVGEGPDAGSVEARAALVFKVMAGIGVCGIVLALIPDSLPNSALLTLAFNLATGLISFLYFLEARGIDRGRPWALAAARPMLVALGAWGAYAAAAGFGQGFVRIPFELAFAVWAFLGDRAAVPPPRPVARSFGLIVAAIPLLGTMAFGYLVFGWGGLLDPDERDLVASLQVDCGDPGAGPPAEIPVSFDWSWSSRAPLPNEVDTLVIGWSGDDAEGRPLYIYEQSAATDPSIRSGQRGALGRSLVEEARAESAAGFHWAVDLSRRDYEPGQVTLTLRLANENPSGTPSLTVRASYVHLGIWRSETAVSCTW
jgi:hypothetical protein